VRCQGLETDIHARWKTGAAGWVVKAMYTYTESLDMGMLQPETRYGRQLAYVPFHLLKIRGGMTFKGFEADLGYKFTGRRYTTDDHDPWLDLEPCHLADLLISYTFITGRNKVILTGSITNLFDTGYQQIRAYPAPGRSFYLSVNYLFNQKSKKNV
jgi:outer membrane cobalamin receptor